MRLDSIRCFPGGLTFEKSRQSAIVHGPGINGRVELSRRDAAKLMLAVHRGLQRANALRGDLPREEWIARVKLTAARDESVILHGRAV
jgi:hypothetical protein